MAQESLYFGELKITDENTVLLCSGQEWKNNQTKVNFLKK